uniref:Legumin J n=1 Tax=Pisum sativum TaxID=3888 RepID=LEGJ_PEA|nr:RecName: Full=Legumin J; Contains: RecName: Full=Legumin J alpha chain; AltName: Full=Legumin J acidic chain; Contains: RecName: Full=Legumin J beta chain; AltName: Full=Legumin J basic chain; Flags: Precursor [Pisum sativum]CAA30067.1 legumin [Pisum sativum]
MSKPFLSLLSLSLLLFASACLATSSEFDRLNQCQLDSINALEPDHRVESEAGLTETWNPNHPELKCAGVSLIRRTIDPNGLHLPSFSPSPQLIFIIQGKGVLGLSFPGCPETYEEPRSSQSRQESRQQQGDSHQKVRRFRKGDIIAIPSGIPYWTYNHGDEPLVAISLLDTSNIANQLDSTPRVFYLGGNPETEFPETQEEQQGRHRQKHSYPVGRRSGHHQQEEESEEQNEGNSVLSGFSSEFLAQTFNTEEDTAKRLRSPRDERSQIVRVEGGLRIIKPKGKEEEEKEQSHSHSHREEKEEEEEEEEDEEEKQRSEERKNGLEETICSAKIRENIADAARADLYNPRAGRISTANSLTLPVLRYLRLSAEYVRLYRNGIYAPHWNINANSLLYVIRGEGRVRIVNCQGNTVFDNKVRKGQLVVVPQNFVVAEQAGEEEGLEYVVFKTNDRAAVSHVQQVFRATPSEVLANAFGLRQRQVTELKLSGNRGPLVHPRSQSQSH